MKFKKYCVILAAMISINAYAIDSGIGYTVEQTQVLHNVPMPEWMKQGGSKSAKLHSASGTVTATAYPANGNPSPSVTTIKGNITGDFYNETNANQYYNLSEYVCIYNTNKCDQYNTTIGLTPGGRNHHDDTLPLNVQLAKGHYQNATSCVVSGAGSAKVVDYAPVDIG